MRVIGITKRILRKVLGKMLLTFRQLETLLYEVEAIVNSRPLVYVENDIVSSYALTPSQFIMLNPKLGTPTMCRTLDENCGTSQVSAGSLLLIWNKGMKILEQFWKIWRNEYLLALRERNNMLHKRKKSSVNAQPTIGRVVLIKEDMPRGVWKMGKIIKITQSADGQIRSAEMILATGRKLIRPINLLYPLE